MVLHHAFHMKTLSWSYTLECGRVCVCVTGFFYRCVSYRYDYFFVRGLTFTMTIKKDVTQFWTWFLQCWFGSKLKIADSTTNGTAAKPTDVSSLTFNGLDARFVEDGTAWRSADLGSGPTEGRQTHQLGLGRYHMAWQGCAGLPLAVRVEWWGRFWILVRTPFASQWDDLVW